MGCDQSTTKESNEGNEEPLHTSRGLDKNMPPPPSTMASPTTPVPLNHWDDGSPEGRGGLQRSQPGSYPSTMTPSVNVGHPEPHSHDVGQISMKPPSSTMTGSTRMGGGGDRPYPSSQGHEGREGRGVVYHRGTTNEDMFREPYPTVTSSVVPPGQENTTPTEVPIVRPTKRFSQLDRRWFAKREGSEEEAPKPTFCDTVDDEAGLGERGGASRYAPMGGGGTIVPGRFSSSFHSLYPQSPEKNTYRSMLNSNVLHDSTISPRKPLRRSSTMMNQAQSLVPNWESVFRGPGFPSHAFTPDAVYRCFAEGNGLLFRLVDEIHHQWAYYNDTKRYDMVIEVTFGHESAVQPLDRSRVTKTVLHPETGSCRLETTIGPGEFVLFMKGEYNGFKTVYEANPVLKTPQEV